jgi:hypothetical protein
MNAYEGSSCKYFSKNAIGGQSLKRQRRNGSFPSLALFEVALFFERFSLEFSTFWIF